MPRRRDHAPSWGEVMDEFAAIAVGGAVLTFALFPFALPMIALTLAALAPLLVLGLAARLVVAVPAAPIVVVRRLRAGGPRASDPSR